MSRPRVVIVGAGLCGSVLAARLRLACDVTVVEQGRHPRPLLDDIVCAEGGVTTTINRGEGLGGTTNYWHNALIELADDELHDNGIDPAAFAAQYQRAWSLFVPPDQLAQCRQLQQTSAPDIPGLGTANMVVVNSRANLWELAQRTWPGAPVQVVYGRARRLECRADGRRISVLIATGRDEHLLDADHCIVAAGGLATPTLLASSLRAGDTLCGGYHDHPMAYVAKLRLRSDSVLKRVSCIETGPGTVRAGYVYQSAGLRTVFYLRPALNLRTASITGDARYALSDLRNDPFSPRKLLAVLRNLEAVREGVLFRLRAGYVGDYYSVLMLGEQASLATRGVLVSPGRRSVLNWHVTPVEMQAYQDCLQQFLAEIRGDVVEANLVPAAAWDCRTCAHHSGTAKDFLADPRDPSADRFAVDGLPQLSVCDASMLRRGGVANTGLTLIGLANLHADQLLSRFGASGDAGRVTPTS